MFARLKKIAERVKQEFTFYQRLYQHPETPWIARLCLGLAIGYLLLPFDLIPDFIPVIGQLDDVVIIPALLYVALKLTPTDVIAICRESVN